MAMKQTDFILGPICRMLRAEERRVFFSVLADLGKDFTISPYGKAQHRKRYLRKTYMFMQNIRSTTFTSDRYCGEDSLKLLTIFVSEIGTNAPLSGFTGGRSNRGSFIYDPVTAACVLPRRLAAPCRWYDFEILFGKHITGISEVFWESIAGFFHNWGHLPENFEVAV